MADKSLDRGIVKQMIHEYLNAPFTGHSVKFKIGDYNEHQGIVISHEQASTTLTKEEFLYILDLGLSYLNIFSSDGISYITFLHNNKEDNNGEN